MSNICYCKYTAFPTNNFLLKVNNTNTRARCEICSELTIKILKRRHLASAAQKLRFPFRIFISKCEENLNGTLHLLKKTLTENYIFCAVVVLVFLLSTLNVFHTFF